MGNVLGKKKRKTAKGKGKGKGNNDHVVSLSANKYLQIELPREIVEDLERPRTGPTTSAKDPAREMYEKLKALDQPAIMVPKPWSEMDQILSQLKSSSAVTTPSPKSTVARYQSPVSKAKEKMVEETPSPTTVIDMSELMHGLDDDARRSVSREKHDGLKMDPLEFIKTKPFNARKVKSLENTISFSTIHTVKELDATSSPFSFSSSSSSTAPKAFGKPETVENVLKRRASPTRRSSDMSSPARLSNELSRRSNELTRRSSEILRRSSEIERRSNEFQRPLNARPSEHHNPHPRSAEIVRSADLTTTRPYSEITFAHSDAVRSFAVSS